MPCPQCLRQPRNRMPCQGSAPASVACLRALLLASARPSLPWQVARWLVGEGVAADSRDAMGRRAHDDTVKHSLSMTDDFTCSCWGRRALDYACFSGHTAVARYLCGLASGACRTETELRLVLRHPRLKLEQYTERRTAPRRAEMRGDAPRCAELRRDAPSCAEMSHTEAQARLLTCAHRAFHNRMPWGSCLCHGRGEKERGRQALAPPAACGGVRLALGSWKEGTASRPCRGSRPPS